MTDIRPLERTLLDNLPWNKASIKLSSPIFPALYDWRPLSQKSGNHYQHVWCQCGHYDGWQALNGRKLSSTDAPIIRRGWHPAAVAGS
jgi:hypothetical protein